MKLISTNPKPAPAFDSLLNEFFSDGYWNWPAPAGANANGNSPAVNISENNDQWRVDLAVPGMKKEDFKIELDRNVLSISAEQQKENAEKTAKYSLKEFGYTNFKRSFRLPENTIDREKISAKYENGVLSIGIPKKEEAKPKPSRMIDIS